MRELRIANPFNLTLLSAIHCESLQQAKDLEKLLHRKFHRFNLNGEWFKDKIGNEHFFQVLRKFNKCYKFKGYDKLPSPARGEEIIGKKKADVWGYCKEIDRD